MHHDKSRCGPGELTMETQDRQSPLPPGPNGTEQQQVGDHACAADQVPREVHLELSCPVLTVDFGEIRPQGLIAVDDAIACYCEAG